MRRSLLSLLSYKRVHFAGKIKTALTKAKGQNNQTAMLTQRNDKGNFLLNDLISQYLTTHDPKPLIHLFQIIGINNTPLKKVKPMIFHAIQQKHWALLNMFTRPSVESAPTLEHQIITMMKPDNLHNVLPFLNGILRQNKKCLIPLIQKTQQIRNKQHKQILEKFLKSQVQQHQLFLLHTGTAQDHSIVRNFLTEQGITPNPNYPLPISTRRP